MLKLNASYSKKVPAEADYSSQQFHCQVEVELSDGLTQEQIQKRLLNSMDESVAHVAKDLLIEKHQITVKNYEDSLTSVTTRLVQFVPRSLLAYQIKKVEKILKSLTDELTAETDETRQIEILTRITEYNKARTRLNNELGRV